MSGYATGNGHAMPMKSSPARPASRAAGQPGVPPERGAGQRSVHPGTAGPADLDEAVRLLDQSTRFLIGERDTFYDGVSIASDGTVPDSGDAATLADFDTIIDANRRFIARVKPNG